MNNILKTIILVVTVIFHSLAAMNDQNNLINDIVGVGEFADLFLLLNQRSHVPSNEEILRQLTDGYSECEKREPTHVRYGENKSELCNTKDLPGACGYFAYLLHKYSSHHNTIVTQQLRTYWVALEKWMELFNHTGGLRFVAKLYELLSKDKGLKTASLLENFNKLYYLNRFNNTWINFVSKCCIKLHNDCQTEMRAIMQQINLKQESVFNTWFQRHIVNARLVHEDNRVCIEYF